MFDAFHFREDSTQRERLAEHIGHDMRVLIAEHITAKVIVHRKHPYKDTGKSFIPVIHQRAIGDAEAGARASKVKPWDAEFCTLKEEENLANTRYRFVPRDGQPTDEADGLYGGKLVGI